MDKHLGDRPPTPIQQREVRHQLKAKRKTEHDSIKSNLSAYLIKVSGCKTLISNKPKFIECGINHQYPI